MAAEVVTVVVVISDGKTRRLRTLPTALRRSDANSKAFCRAEQLSKAPLHVGKPGGTAIEADVLTEV
jgi:hypothetical protein